MSLSYTEGPWFKNRLTGCNWLHSHFFSRCYTWWALLGPSCCFRSGNHPEQSWSWLSLIILELQLERAFLLVSFLVSLGGAESYCSCNHHSYQETRAIRWLVSCVMEQGLQNHKTSFFKILFFLIIQLDTNLGNGVGAEISFQMLLKFHISCFCDYFADPALGAGWQGQPRWQGQSECQGIEGTLFKTDRTSLDHMTSIRLSRAI